MWKKDSLSLYEYDEADVKDGYIVASGRSVGYGPLSENKLIGRGVFGDVFHIFKVNPEYPLRVRQNETNGKVHIWPVSQEFDGKLLGQIQRDDRVWNASMLMIVPGDEQTLSYNEGMTKNVFAEGFLSATGENKPVSLINLLESKGVDFDGNYGNLSYSFVPPAQVGSHLFYWLSRKHTITSHNKTFDQKEEGHVELIGDALRKIFWISLIPDLERKFGERIIFPKQIY